MERAISVQIVKLNILFFPGQRLKRICIFRVRKLFIKIEMKYDFDKIIDRKGTESVKYDLLQPIFGTEDLLPMWVADMDFEVADFIREAMIDRMNHPVFGYTYRSGRFYETVASWLQRRHGWEWSLIWSVLARG